MSWDFLSQAASFFVTYVPAIMSATLSMVSVYATWRMRQSAVMEEWNAKLRASAEMQGAYNAAAMSVGKSYVEPIKLNGGGGKLTQGQQTEATDRVHRMAWSMMTDESKAVLKNVPTDLKQAMLEVGASNYKRFFLAETARRTTATETESAASTAIAEE